MGSGTASSATLLLSAAGNNIEEALGEMEYFSSRELNSVYMAFVILGEEFARTDVGPVVDVISPAPPLQAQHALGCMQRKSLRTSSRSLSLSRRASRPSTSGSWSIPVTPAWVPAL
jgi:hypothetical protein